ncbi:thermonuclease family protein [Floridanema evergladense]|uniref:Thermonuclease family protein n=1 Tax=Floridaenema evergladense BLCC-F167 TaxID=3153639 RepID=A0ABV4WNC0_9CYAN
MFNLLIPALLILALQPLPTLAQFQPNQQNALFTIVSVGDGDTIRVKQNNQTITVRLGCIDAPELAQKPWGERSKYRLGQFLPAGQSVRLRKIDTDRYGRTVAEVFKDDRSINLQMVREGYAVIYPEYFGGCAATRNQYLQAEAGAKQNRLALWSQPNPVMPWAFRRQPNRPTTPQPIASPTPAASPSPDTTKPLREPTQGQGCRCPYDYDRRGNICGGRSAYSRPGGESPRCYVGD